LGVSSLDLGRSVGTALSFSAVVEPATRRGEESDGRRPRWPNGNVSPSDLCGDCVSALQKNFLEICASHIYVLATTPAMASALLGRFLPRLGPFGTPSGPFSLAR